MNPLNEEEIFEDPFAPKELNTFQKNEEDKDKVIEKANFDAVKLAHKSEPQAPVHEELESSTNQPAGVHTGLFENPDSSKKETSPQKSSNPPQKAKRNDRLDPLE